MSNYKIIYSLRIHVALQAQGFKHVAEMPNPRNAKYICWVYEQSADLAVALEALMSKEAAHD